MEDYINVGVFLFSQAASSQLSSALLSLTSVFGMGTGGPSSQSTPTVFRLRGNSRCPVNSFIIPRFSHLSSAIFAAQTLLLQAAPGRFGKLPSTRIPPLTRAGDPYRIRTDVNGVRGHCLNHLTNGPFPSSYLQSLPAVNSGAPSRTRTGDPLIKSQLLYQLS